MSKADYVRDKIAQGHDGKHACHWPGCDKRVAPAQWGCRQHWYRLPQGIRNAIWSAFRPGQEETKTPSERYIAAARAAQDWIKDHGSKERTLFERMAEAQRDAPG